MKLCPWLMALMLAWIGVAAAAGDEQKPLPDKSGFSIIHPTPGELLRELQPDRPSKSESPYTVDAGHILLELSFVEYTLDDTASVRTKTWNVAPLNLKVGLLNNTDLEFLLDDYLHVRTKDRVAGTTTTQSGFGDLTIRVKVNLWGNDRGDTAFALLPLVKIPTNTDHLGNNAIEGGLILPLSVNLPLDFTMALETAAFAVRDEEGKGYHSECANIITLSRKIAGELEGYAEFFSNVSTEKASDWQGTVDLGLTYNVTRTSRWMAA